MNTDFERIRQIFLTLVEQPAAQWEALLDEACANDPELRQQVALLLKAHVEGEGILDRNEAGRTPTGAYESMSVRTGTVIGPYKLLQAIGEGGMGTVYMAEQTHPVQRKVALKVIKAGMDSRQIIARFEAERQALAMMDHVDIARVLDAGATEAGLPYFVMELVHGVPITKYCDDNHLTPRERLELFVPVCQAIQHAHQKGIIHRDIKPSNVMVTLYDGKPVPKVIDFGVAKATEQKLTERTLFTQYGTMVGTLEYMSPEQAEISALGVDTRSDIYSLGVLLYELLTGNTPLTHLRMKEVAYAEILRMIKEEEPPKPSTRLSDSGEALASISANRHTEPAKLTKLMRGELDWIVMKCLEKDRNRRYETANGFAMDVQRYLADEPVQACPPTAGYRLRKFARRNKAAVAVTALVLFFLVLIGSGIGWAVRDRVSAAEVEAHRQQAERQANLAGQVELIFAEVGRLEREQKWAEALAAAQRAQAAVTGGEADAATAQQVRELLKDLEFIDRLEQIRMQRATWVEGTFDNAGADREYARAFRDYGVDALELTVETSIDRLKTRPTLTVPLAAALDDWVFARRLVSEKDAAGWKRLVAVARGIDPEPLRDRLRSTWGQPVSEVRDELRRLADSIDIRAQHPATLVSLSRTLRRVKHTDSALRLLRDAQFVYPEDFWLNFELGLALNEQKDHEGAIRFYTAAVSIRNNSAAAHNNLGNALSDLKKLDEAIACYRKAIELDRKHAIAYSNLGNALRGQKKLPEAIAAYHKAIEFDPKLVFAYNGHGNALREQKKLPDAIAAYEKAIEIDPNLAFAYNGLGNALREQKKLPEAIAAYEKAIEIDPNLAMAFNGLGNALFDQKKLPEAVAAYYKAIAIDPKYALAHYNRGRAFAERGLVAAASYAYHQASELDPIYDNAVTRFGNSLIRQGKLDDAIVAFRVAAGNVHGRVPFGRVAGYQDSLLNALNDRARQLITDGDPKSRDPKRAVQLAEEAAALSRNSEPYSKTLGVAHYRAGNWKVAVYVLDKVRQRNSSKDSVTLFFLSMAHGQLNEKEQALAFFEQAAQWRMGFGFGWDRAVYTEEELRRLCAEAAALLGLEVPPTLKERPLLTPGPTLLKPAAGATLDYGLSKDRNSKVWEFAWSDVPGATQYHLYMTGATQKWVIYINDPTISSSSYRPEANRYHARHDGFPLGRRWKVRALVNGIWTDWSEERTFTLPLRGEGVGDKKSPSPKK